MKCLLLAGGYGSRLAPITQEIPKCLVPISGVPLIEYWLVQLIEFGIQEILINTHYLSNVVEDYFRYSKWKKYVTLVYEQTLLGTAGTIQKNKDFFGSEPFLVAHADNLIVIDLNSFLACHQSREKEVEITMMTFTTDAPHSCGIVVVDQKGVVNGFYEKVQNPPGDRANAAVYIFESSIFEQFKNLKFSIVDISNDLIPLYLGKIQTWHNNLYLRDIGHLNSLNKANQDIFLCCHLKKLYEKLVETHETQIGE